MVQKKAPSGVEGAYRDLGITSSSSQIRKHVTFATLMNGLKGGQGSMHLITTRFCFVQYFLIQTYTNLQYLHTNILLNV